MIPLILGIQNRPFYDTESSEVVGGDLRVMGYGHRFLFGEMRRFGS